MKKFINLENLIYLTIFLLPSYLIKLNFFGVPTNVLEILILVTIIWVILKRSFEIALKPGFVIAIGAIFLGLIISTLASKNYMVGIGIIKGWFVLPLLFMLIVRNVISTEKKRNIYSALYFSGVVVTVISLGYYFLGLVTFDGRLQAFFNSPNYLAMHLAPAIIIGSVSVKRTLLNIVSLVIIVISFYLTYSYAAWAAVILCVVASGIIGSRNKISTKKIGLVAGVIVIIILSQWNGQKFMDLKQGSERSSMSSRGMIWRAAGEIGKDNWFFGIGPGNFQNKYLEYQKYFPLYLEWAVPHPHNLYFAFWLYSGVAGLCGFITLIFLWFKEMLRKEKDIIWFMSLGIMIYFLLHGLVDTTYFKNDLAVIFWINFISIL